MSFGCPPHPEPIFWEPEAPLFQEVGNPKSLVGGLGNANSAFKSRLAPRQSWQAPAPARAQSRPHESPNPSPRAPKTHPQRPKPDRPRCPSEVPGERVLVKSTLAEWQKPWLYGPPQECSWAQSLGVSFGSFPHQNPTFSGNPTHHFPSRLPSHYPSRSPSSDPHPRHQEIFFQIQKYISSPSSRSSKYLPFVDATSPKPRKALHSAVVLRMRPCTKIHVSSPGKNVVKNLSLP